MDARWTLDELTRRCGEALAHLGLQQENGQVADAPNGRAIRWYTSIGLLGRPEQRGRVAFYGAHHLQQLVAIKRLQATGLALSAVQQALAGKSDDDVAAVADLPAALLTPPAGEDTVTVSEEAPYRAFWAADVADADVAALPALAPAPAPAPTPTPAAGPARVVIDAGDVTVIVPGVDAAHLPLLHDAVAGFVRDLVARGLLATPRASAPTTPAKENEQ